MLFAPIFFIFIFTLHSSESAPTKEDLYELSLVHFNDFHARFEETSKTSTKCIPGQPCIGGFPRLYTVIKELKEKKPHSVVLNAGDSFQGTLWYTLLRYNVTKYFMNMLPLDAHTLGNHEFDNGISGVTPYMKLLNAPMLVSNIDDSLEPTMQGLYNSSCIIERRGRKIGIIGVILQTTNTIANTGKLKFTDEIEAVRRESDLLTAQGVDIIIVLSHCGIDVDLEIAKKAGSNIDIFVGGHTHTLLYTGTPPSGETARGEYPLVVQQDSDTKVLVVQASCYTKYLGDINVQFDSKGKIQSWVGQPIYLDSNIIQDPFILAVMAPFKRIVDVQGKVELGYSKVHLSRSECIKGECNFGSFLSDAFIDSLVPHAEEGHWTYASICLQNQAAIRASIVPGPITYEDVAIAQPFGNSLHTFEIKGKYLVEAFEYSVSTPMDKAGFTTFYMLQVSGVHLTFNVTKPVGQRLVSALVRCSKCTIPKYSAIKAEEVYRVAAPAFFSEGGDGFTAISNNKMNTVVWDMDIEIISKYITKSSPIIQGIDGRIVVLQ